MKKSLGWLSLASILAYAADWTCDVYDLLKVTRVPLPQVRRDLLEGHMPKQAAPTEQVTAQRRDQRPMLRRFTLPRNEFAF